MASASADTLQPVELADGVEIHLRVAGPAVRSVAWTLDLLVFLLMVIVLFLTVALTLGQFGSGQVVGGIMLLSMFLLNWFYNVIFEMGAKAATPGQRAMGIKVASVSGGPVRLPQSLIRNLLRVVDFMPGFYLLGVTCCLFNHRFQRLGDLVADTVVVYAEPRVREVPPMQVNAEPIAPPGPLSRPEQAALTAFLERAPHWSDARKVELADLLEPLTGRTGLSGLVRVCGTAIWAQQGAGANGGSNARQESTEQRAVIWQ